MASYTLQDAIHTATREGFKVWHSDDPETLGWWVTTPKKPRRPPEDHGVFKDETRAWLAAASLAAELP
jgi:hypothetical protein